METKALNENIEVLSNPEEVSMADEWFDVASIDHFWIEWRFRILKKLLKKSSLTSKKVLEIGCGSGLVMDQFDRQLNMKIDGCDLNAYALNKIHEIGGKKYVYDIFDQNEKLVNQYDLVVLFDVIEHIEDDVQFLGRSADHLKDGGLVIINVPALMSLFSKYDTQAGHQRRYTKESLRKVCEANGLEVIKATYWGFSMLPIAQIRKMILKNTPDEDVIRKGFAPPSKLMNSMLKLLMKFETTLIGSPPLGTSLMLLARVNRNGHSQA